MLGHWNNKATQKILQNVKDLKKIKIVLEYLLMPLANSLSNVLMNYGFKFFINTFSFFTFWRLLYEMRFIKCCTVFFFGAVNFSTINAISIRNINNTFIGWNTASPIGAVSWFFFSWKQFENNYRLELKYLQEVLRIWNIIFYENNATYTL